MNLDPSPFDHKLPFGVDPTGRLVHVDQVPRGLACECTCPNCNLPLVAHQGPERSWHFQHEAQESGSGGGGCLGAFETMAHKLAKQIIADAATIRLPPLIGCHQGRSVRAVAPERQAKLLAVRLETSLGNIRPDILATCDDNSELAIELYVAHRCGADKIQQIRNRRIATVEIDLSEFRSGLNDTFQRAVLQGKNRIWLWHPQQATADAKVTAEITYRRDKEAAISAHYATMALEAQEAEQAELAAAAQIRAEQLAADQLARTERLAKLDAGLTAAAHAGAKQRVAELLATADAPPQRTVRTAEYDARRCFVCQSSNAWFGFAPPNASPSATLWACLAHSDRF